MALASLSDNEWQQLLPAAADRYGTPCYVTRWRPVEHAAASLERRVEGRVDVKLWLSFKTHPVVPLLCKWLQSGRGVEVVSEYEFLTATQANAPLFAHGLRLHLA